MPSHTKAERKGKLKDKLKERIFSEVFNNPPEVTKGKSKEDAKKQKVAIALAKIRREKRKR